MSIVLLLQAGGKCGTHSVIAAISFGMFCAILAAAHIHVALKQSKATAFTACHRFRSYMAE